MNLFDPFPAVESRVLSTSAGTPARTSLEVRFGFPFVRDLEEQLGLEAWQVASSPTPGTLLVRGVTSDALRVHFQLGVLPEGSWLLRDVLLRISERLPLPVACFIIDSLATVLAELHAVDQANGGPRVHGAVCASAVVVEPSGAVQLIGPGTPLLDRLLLPAATEEELLRVAAPEAILKQPIPASDVHALGALAFELLSGRPYRAEISGGALRTEIAAHRAPELDRRLSSEAEAARRVLARALAPDIGARPPSPAAFAHALAEALGVERSYAETASSLGALVRELPADERCTGMQLLSGQFVPPAHKPKAYDSVPPAPRRRPSDALAAWNEVLNPASEPPLNDPLARAHHSGIEPILLSEVRRPSADSLEIDESYRIEPPRPRGQRPRPAPEKKAPSTRRFVVLLAVVLLLAIVAIVNLAFDIPIARLFGREVPESTGELPMPSLEAEP